MTAFLRATLNRVDDLENHSRRYNLLFRGLHGTEGESGEESEEKVLKFASENIGITGSSYEIEWALRLGAYLVNSITPIILKFKSCKTKNKLLLASPKLRGTIQSLSQDFSPSIITARRHLDNGKSQSRPFKLRFNISHIGS